MNALRRSRPIRSLAVLVFLLGVLTVSLTAMPETVTASCGQEYYWVYYDENGNPVGECWGWCGGPAGCWGTITGDRQGYSAECPCWP